MTTEHFVIRSQHFVHLTLLPLAGISAVLRYVV